ncbi:PA domain-containing protein/TFR_dimer domain-containing protein/Peptidase_M28 domain-containing protein [Cephalotus follicularis]|uniref:PA domain-containing protein/TFR_dimer domain-containing protein/Peptidase_M28 domain-containing protein n=1 Tax=Cephalotus follicularis TaxID=3775 RepID=A0A1Q3CW02_CEPFO|nr:PA domain-containing protein/TFR_dimer domain-containing protein/Peptidase_M28 domain-containing protein [Cephalotus follicularis]
MMIKTATATFLAIATSFYFLLISPPPTKSYYHSLYLSDSLTDNASISHHLYTLTRRPHVAGTQANAETAAYVLSTFKSCSMQARITSYDVSLAYPVQRSLTLTPPPPDQTITFDLRQEIYDGDPYADVAKEVLPTFHAYAKSGTVTGPVVYVNYGRAEDHTTLKEMGVNVSGTIVLARYGRIYRGDIVQNAYEAGAIGAIVYTDKKDYGGGGGDTKWFPDDKWMPPSGVQVGSVYNGAGDPQTPGWASTIGCERLSDDDVEKGGDVPLIPSLPISAADGETILRSIGGQVANDDWQGSDDAPTYRVGPGPGVVNLSYSGKQVIATIQNVIGVIKGEEEPDRFVLLGNHRDAWTFGAVDPNSGTAALLEVAQRLAKLQKNGWKPRRTIVFCNWDAEEYGLIGSTEWVEENREMLTSRAVAYLNVDSAVSGAEFHASATPQLDELLKQATQQVQDPNNSSQTIYESWIGSSNSPRIGRLGGGGSDYAAFVQHIGAPAADMSFGGGYPVYHSMYDDFIWMERFGDPMFHRHVAVASVWGLVALRLADEEFLPYDYLSYAHELQKSTMDLEDKISDKGINLLPMFKSIEDLTEAATKIYNQKKAIEESKGWASISKRDHLKVRELNDKMMMAERAFTDRDGLKGRPWYKHLIYAPSKHNDYGSTSFPGIDDAIEEAKSLNTAEAWNFVQHEVWRVSRAIRHASLVLNGELT